LFSFSSPEEIQTLNRPSRFSLALQTDRSLVAAVGDGVDAMLPLPGAAVALERGIVLLGREGVGAQFLELLPGVGRQIFGLGMDIHAAVSCWHRRAAQNKRS